jgi:hypothetical protein
MSALSLALGAYLKKAAADGSVTVHRDEGDLRVQNASLGIDVRVSYTDEPQPVACRSFPLDETLASIGAVPLTYIASFDQAVRYRVVHPPSGSYHLTKNTSASIRAYGPYIVVSLWTPVLPPGSLGCLGSEYYRINPLTKAVQPFDGCVEGHNRVLPGLSQLPPR